MPLTAENSPTEEQFAEEFEQAAEGDIIFEGSRDGYDIVLRKVDGTPAVETTSSVADGFCHAAALAAVYTIGAAGLAFLAASGGGVILGVFLTASQLARISAALAGAGGVSALVSEFIC